MTTLVIFDGGEDEDVKTVLKGTLLEAQVPSEVSLSEPFSVSRSRRGFSLAEVAIVLGIVALLSAILFPALMFWQRNQELSNTALAVESAVNLVRMQSMVQGHHYGVGLDIAEPGGRDSYKIIGLYDLDKPEDNMEAGKHVFPKSVRYQRPLPGSAMASVQTEAGLSSAEDGLIAFRASGEAESRYLNPADKDPEIVLAGRGGKTKKISVNRITGKVAVS